MTKQKWIPRAVLSGGVLYAIVALIWTGLFFLLALRTYFADSEIWLLTISQRLLDPHDIPSIYYKYTFHLLTYLFSHFAPSEPTVYTWARLGWAAVASGAVWLTARLFTHVYRREHLLWPLFIFLLTAGLFLNQGFRIRADILGLFTHMLYLATFFQAREKGVRRSHFAALTAINVYMLLSTPKTVIFLICQVALCLGWLKGSTRHRRLLWLLTFSTMGPMIVGVTALLLFPFIGIYTPMLAMKLAADFYMKSYDPNLVNPAMFTAIDFYHFFKLFTNSPFHALILCTWLILFFVRIFKKNRLAPEAEEPLQIYASLLFFFVIIYNQKLPFFLGPFLTPVLAQAFMMCMKALPRPRTLIPTAVLATTILAVSITGLVEFFNNIKNNTNYWQLQAISILDLYSQHHPELKIWDVVGLLPRKNKVFIFLGPSEVAQKTKIIRHILEEDPDMIVLIYKFRYLEPEFPPILQKHWVPIAKDVWAKGRFISPLTQPLDYVNPIKIGAQEYWVMPMPKEKYILDTDTHHSLNKETLGLDASRKVTQTDPIYLAIPKKHLSLVLTDVQPIWFPYTPTGLFRFDTTF